LRFYRELSAVLFANDGSCLSSYTILLNGVCLLRLLAQIPENLGTIETILLLSTVTITINGIVHVSSGCWCVSRRETRSCHIDPRNTGYWPPHPQTGELLLKISRNFQKYR